MKELGAGIPGSISTGRGSRHSGGVTPPPGAMSTIPFLQGGRIQAGNQTMPSPKYDWAEKCRDCCDRIPTERPL